MNAKVNAGHVGSSYSAGISNASTAVRGFPCRKAATRRDRVAVTAEQLRQPAESFSSRGRQFCLWERLTREPVVSPATALGIIGKIQAGLRVSREERRYVDDCIEDANLRQRVAVRKRLALLEAQVKRARLS